MLIINFMKQNEHGDLTLLMYFQLNKSLYISDCENKLILRKQFSIISNNCSQKYVLDWLEYDQYI